MEVCEDSEEVDYENMPPLEGSPGSSPSRKEDSDTPEVAAQIKKQQIAEEEDVRWVQFYPHPLTTCILRTCPGIWQHVECQSGSDNAI